MIDFKDLDQLANHGACPLDHYRCENFRRHPDALAQAAALDAQYGRNPPLQELPLYGVVFSFKDPFDTKDMRSTGGGDAAYDIDFPARDHILVEQLRKKGAIISRRSRPPVILAPSISKIAPY